MKNIKKLSEIIKITREAKRQGFKVVTTNGAYDILHIGHLCTFEFAKGKGDILIVGVPHSAYKGLEIPTGKYVVDLWDSINKDK